MGNRQMERLLYYLGLIVFLSAGACAFTSSVYFLRFWDEWEKYRGRSDWRVSLEVVTKFYEEDIPQACRTHRAKWIKSIICFLLLMPVMALLVLVSHIFVTQ